MIVSRLYIHYQNEYPSSQKLKLQQAVTSKNKKVLSLLLYTNYLLIFIIQYYRTI